MFNIAISRRDHLVVACSGEPAPNDYLGGLALIADICAREGMRRVLIDMSGIPYVTEDEDRLEVARVAAVRLKGVRVAMVVDAPWLLQEPEIFANEIGLQTQMFRDRAEAQAWLAQGHR
ncbi:STAS/SEC14 domain-containing protein [Ramlibacter sp. MMS24-I3-19]|uniref:STAS/SEC14 domain-containing protein n=1 Tax=Ramlibacter sp. MMS24-I3-19 TaxID=3416606 RepID=UPI003D04E5B4